MRITADVVLRARAFINPIKDRELDLRGLKIPLIENLGVTQDQFDVVDLSDNEVKRLDNFPRMKRLKTILLSNNFVNRLGSQLGDQIPELESLVLTNNKIASLSEIDHLAGLHKLSYLSLVDNPVVRQQHYRAYVIHKLPNLKVLDFKKIKFDERKLAAKLFRSEAGRQLEADVANEGKVIASETAEAAGAAEKRVLTGEQKRIAAEMIDNAKTPEELDRVERQLRAGIFKLPDGSTLPPAPAPAPAAAPSPPRKKAKETSAPAPAPIAAPPSSEAAPSPSRRGASVKSPSKKTEADDPPQDPPAAESMEVDESANGNGDAPAAEQANQLSEVEIDKMKVAELKEALKERGLSTAGLKAELVERLKSSAS